ncbi:hypothetical protein D3C81_1613540 [compost metagenome]
MVIAPKAGTIRGTIILKKIPNSEHPSIRPASMKSFGRLRANCLKKKIGRGATTKGRITPQIESIIVKLIISL